MHFYWHRVWRVYSKGTTLTKPAFISVDTNQLLESAMKRKTCVPISALCCLIVELQREQLDF